MFESIIIQKSDKGNSVVILDRESYVDRVMNIISDTSKFQKLNVKEGKDYIRNQEKRITSVLYELNRKGALTDADYTKISPKGSSPSVLYGFSKVHKTWLKISPSNVPSSLPSIPQLTNSLNTWSRFSNNIPKTLSPRRTPSHSPTKSDSSSPIT